MKIINLKIITIIFIFFTTFIKCQENYIKEFKIFAENYKPTYIDNNGNKLAVARIPELPKKLSNLKIKKNKLTHYLFLVL